MENTRADDALPQVISDIGSALEESYIEGSDDVVESSPNTLLIGFCDGSVMEITATVKPPVKHGEYYVRVMERVIRTVEVVRVRENDPTNAHMSNLEPDYLFPAEFVINKRVESVWGKPPTGGFHSQAEAEKFAMEGNVFGGLGPLATRE